MIDGQMFNMFDKMDATLKVLYSSLPPVGQTAYDFAAGRILEDQLGFDPRTYIRTFVEDLSLVTREGPIYGTPQNGMAAGRHYNYTLVMDYEEAKRRFDEYRELRVKQLNESRAQAGVKSGATKRARSLSRKVNAASDDGITREEIHAVVAIVGDDPPVGLAAHVPAETLAKVRTLRTRDEAAALVEATRQYLRRTDTIGSQIDSLEKTAKELGVQFDRDAILASFTLNRDDRLETVADLLPYIDGLEAKVQKATTQVEELREKGRKYDQLINDHRKLQELHNRTIAGRVAQGQSVSSTH